MRSYLLENPEIANQIEAQLRAKLLPTGPVEVPLDEAEESAALKQA